MFDASVYEKIFNAAHFFLQQNGRRFGAEFCESFMRDWDPRNGQSQQRNAAHLTEFVSYQARQLNGGQNWIRDDQQLFDIVGNYIISTFGRVQNASQGGFGFGNQQSRSSFGGMNSGGSSMSFGNSGGLGFGQQRMGSAAGLVDDTVDTRNQQNQSPQSSSNQTTPSSSLSFSTSANVPPSVGIKYVDNPLDELPNTNVEFIDNPGRPLWGQELAKDLRIVVGERSDLKTRDQRFTINRTGAFHQTILDDPMDVVKDFFEIVPDSVLGTPFLFRISYNHLSTIDVPTEDFKQIRQLCIESVKDNPQVFLHKKIMEVLGTMKMVYWKAMSRYLVDHVNRALYLSCRLSNNPKGSLSISEFEDLDELLSSSFKHPITTLPEGRSQLEKIVGTAIWNAIVMNSDVMFGDDDIPTHAIQSSPAFPFSMNGVYPNKYAIPTSNDASAGAFMERLKDKELSKKTYIISKRSVTITNILGKKVLPSIGKDPSVIENSVADVLEGCVIPFTRLDIRKSSSADIRPYVSESYPSDQLDEYYENSDGYYGQVIARYSKEEPTAFPVDQTIYAVQYGVKPEDYLMSLDVFSTIDNNLGKDQIILAKKKDPTLHSTV